MARNDLLPPPPAQALRSDDSAEVVVVVADLEEADAEEALIEALSQHGAEIYSLAAKARPPAGGRQGRQSCVRERGRDDLHTAIGDCGL